jgi:hypothetical protein
MGRDALIREAEREVLAAAKEWARLVDAIDLDESGRRLKMAVYMLHKAKSVSGEYRFIAGKSWPPRDSES